MIKKRLQEIKKAQRETLLLRELSKLFLQLILDDKELAGLNISSVSLSPDKSMCTVFFYAPGGLDEFEAKLGRLILYKPSLRQALSKATALRHTPNLVFKYDKYIEKQHRVEELLNQIKTEEEES